MIKKVNFILLTLVIATTVLTACVPSPDSGNSDADIASLNLAMEAEQFNVARQIIYYNTITDTVMYTVEGYCSIETNVAKNRLEVVCKNKETDEIMKVMMTNADNVTAMIIDTKSTSVDLDRPKIIIKPRSFVPDFDIVINK